MIIVYGILFSYVSFLNYYVSPIVIRNNTQHADEHMSSQTDQRMNGILTKEMSFNRQPSKIETIYVNKFLKETREADTKDSLCFESYYRRVALCIKIFRIKHFREELGVEFNFQAFLEDQTDFSTNEIHEQKNNIFSCSLKRLRFIKEDVTQWQPVEQSMYLCPAFKSSERKFEDYFYLFGGELPDSIIICVREEDNTFSFYLSIINIGLNDIPSTLETLLDYVNDQSKETYMDKVRNNILDES